MGVINTNKIIERNVGAHLSFTVIALFELLPLVNSMWATQSKSESRSLAPSADWGGSSPAPFFFFFLKVI